MFSTITTVASTIMPMLMARPPSEVRLADSPVYHMRMKATIMQKGIAKKLTDRLVSALIVTEEAKVGPSG